MSGVTGGGRKRTMAWNEAPAESRKGPVSATPQAYGTAPPLDPSGRSATQRGLWPITVSCSAFNVSTSTSAQSLGCHEP